MLTTFINVKKRDIKYYITLSKKQIIWKIQWTKNTIYCVNWYKKIDKMLLTCLQFLIKIFIFVTMYIDM